MSKGSIAVAYSMKKKKNKASGGMVKSGDPEMDFSKGGEVDQKGVHAGTKPKGGQSIAGDIARGSNSKRKSPAHNEYMKDLSSGIHKSKLEELKSMKGPHGNYAKGGDVDKPSNQLDFSDDEVPVNTVDISIDDPAKKEAANYADGGDVDEPVVEKTPDQAGSGPVSKEEAQKFAQGMCPSCGYSKGGEVSSHHGHTDSGYQTSAHEMDMVGRAMLRHGVQMLSKGGKVANTDLPVADFKPNEFDDLHLRDDLEQHYTGKSSGDEDGDHRSHEEDDLVARAMLKRKAKR